jgi:hypothetical protein
MAGAHVNSKVPLSPLHELWHLRRRSLSAKTAEAQAHFGDEHLHLQLVPHIEHLTALQKQRLSEIEFCYLPRRGLGAAMLAVAMVKNFEELGFKFRSVYLDWPNAYQPHLSKIRDVFPGGLLLHDSSVFQASEQKLESSQQSIDLIEPLDPRRILIQGIEKSELMPELLSSTQIYCVGSSRNNLCSLLQSSRSVELENQLSTLEMLPGGSFSFLEARLKILKELKNNSIYSDFQSDNIVASAEAFESQEQVFAVSKYLLADHPHEQDLKIKTLVVLDEWGFLNLPKQLSKIMNNALVSKETTLPVYLKKNSSLKLAKISDDHLAQYAACNAPVVTRFLELNFKKTDLAPFEIFTQALYQSFKVASAAYENWTKSGISKQSQNQIFQYMYLLAKEDLRKFPNQFEVLLAAQSVVNSNLSFEWLKECRHFPSSENQMLFHSLPTLDVPLENFVDKVTTLNIARFETLQAKKPRPKLALAKQKTTRKLASETQGVSELKYADNRWVHEDHPYSCSFPQEDADMEEFAFDLLRQAKEKSLAKDTHTTEMTTSLADGLNARETARNWHKNVFMVNEELHLGRSDIGAVVFEFGEHFESTERFSWRAFWQAEFHDKSHLMFYATPFQNEIIGPGIAKSEFGGFSVLPLTAVAFDPWHDPFIRAHCEHPAHALLLASALGTLEKNVLFISQNAPPVWLIRLLKQSGKSILFQKSDEVPQDKLRRLKTFHILAEAGVRSYAEKYIRKDTL